MKNHLGSPILKTANLYNFFILHNYYCNNNYLVRTGKLVRRIIIDGNLFWTDRFHINDESYRFKGYRLSLYINI